MKISKRIASLFLAGFLICVTNFEVFAADNEPARIVDDEYKTCYEENVNMNIVEEEEYFDVYSDGRTIKWEAQKVDDAMYADCTFYARKKSPNINYTDEIIIEEGSQVHRIGLSPNGWDIIEIDREFYFV